jgi:hypothetical protein
MTYHSLNVQLICLRLRDIIEYKYIIFLIFIFIT